MQKVITINLNGNAYQLDESAYDVLRAWLDRAARQLADNPDRDEIMADFEQAIAEKCQKVLGANKTVVSAAEMEQIAAEMGPVDGGGRESEGGAGPAAATAGAAAAPRTKRLYRLREGAMWEGVCTGLAAFTGLDVTIIRIAFVMLALATFGAILLGYMVLAWIIPEARTSDERAAAYGQPFNAQEIVDQVRKHAAAFAGGDDWKQWKRQWREQRRHWRGYQREWRRHWQRIPAPPPFTWWNPGRRPNYEPPIWIGYLLPLFSIISLALFTGLILSIVSLVNTAALFGWPLPPGLPIWGAVVILVVSFQIVTGPLRAARHASSYAFAGAGSVFAAWDALVGLGFAGLLIWLLMRHMPPVHDFAEFMRSLPAAFRALTMDFKVWVAGVAESF